MARPATEAPETQFYFITHRSRAFPVPRVRTVVRGERASRSIVNRTTGLWSIWRVASLIPAVLILLLVYAKTRWPEVASRRASIGPSNVAGWRRGGLDDLYYQQTEGNEHKLGSCLVEFFSRPPSAGRRLQFRRLWMKTGLELI